MGLQTVLLVSSGRHHFGTDQMEKRKNCTPEIERMGLQLPQ